MDGHIEKETMAVEVNIPEHDPRTCQPLFEKTRKELIERDKGCFVCGSEEGLEAHHHPIEWSLAHMIDWEGRIRKDFFNFDWTGFDPEKPYTFVDNMLVNGLLLCKHHHTGKDEGIHNMPFPLWIAQKYGKEGYKFSDVEVIHHAAATESN